MEWRRADAENARAKTRVFATAPALLLQMHALLQMHVLAWAHARAMRIPMALWALGLVTAKCAAREQMWVMLRLAALPDYACGYSLNALALAHAAEMLRLRVRVLEQVPQQMQVQHTKRGPW